MIKVLIIEDEISAAERLKMMLNTLNQEFELLAIFDSVSFSVDYLKSNPHPDLIFMDIHLADGLSFEILDQVEVSTPVIFITAYDEFAIRAFRLNSIDYLLKPLKIAELKQAVNKFEMLMGQQRKLEVSSLLKALQGNQKSFQKRLMLRLGQTLRVVEIADIAYFYTEDKADYLCTSEGQKMLIDFHMDEIQSMVDPCVFFRINRQFIVNIKSIENMSTYSKSRVKLALKPPCSIETIVSAERSSEFKIWLVGK